jgi:hypothetical protein
MKKKAWIFLLLTIPLGSWIPIPHFHYLNYDIFVAESKIGEMRAIKNEAGPITTYSIQTTISFKVFENYDVNYQLSTSYKNNMMIETALKNIVNGKLEDNVHLKWNGSKYMGYSNQKAITLQEKVILSIARLYYYEPITTSKVFSEKFLDFQPIKLNKKNEYMLHLDDGNKSKYTYQNGICSEVSTNKGFLKISIKLRPTK